MQFGFKRAAVIAIATFTPILTTGCETKIAQCNKLIQVANKASTEIQKTSSSKGNKATQLTKMAKSLDRYSKEIGAIKLQDSKLKGFQTRFVQMYQQLSGSSRSLVTAVNKKNAPAAEQALAKMKVGAGKEPRLIEEANQYCQAK